MFQFAHPKYAAFLLLQIAKYLSSQMAKCICLKLQKVSVWNFKIYLYQIAKPNSVWRRHRSCLLLQGPNFSSMALSYLTPYLPAELERSSIYERGTSILILPKLTTDAGMTAVIISEWSISASKTNRIFFGIFPNSIPCF